MAGGKKSRKAGARRDGLWLSSSANSISDSSLILERDMSINEDDTGDAVSEESEEDEALKEAVEEQKKLAEAKAERKFRLRVLTKPIKFSGKKFKTQLFFCGADHNIFSDPQDYFKLEGNHWDYTHDQKIAFHKNKLTKLDVLVLFQENRNPRVYELYVNGDEVLKSIPEFMEVDYSSKFRREAFAKWFISKIEMKYTVTSDCHFAYREWSAPMTYLS